ncbi:hypothetical protein JCM14076_22200 [Methylosoma difficile]
MPTFERKQSLQSANLKNDFMMVLPSKIASAERESHCFVAGTLVHTQEGLKPIEQIQVGDWVLSKPDSGEGEPEYKRVTKTFVREDQEVWLVEYVIGNEMRTHALVVTGNHPVWVDRQGWTPVYNLRGGDSLVIIDADTTTADEAWVFRVSQIFATDTPDVGWSGGRRNTDNVDMQDYGPTVDLRNGEVKVTQPDEDTINRSAAEMNEDLKRRVYNFEVEDFHTYFVGKCGVWVHNQYEIETQPVGCSGISNPND